MLENALSLDLSLELTELLASVAPRIDERIEALLPRALDAASIAGLVGEARYAFDEAALTEALADPVWHCLDAGGKRWRPGLMLITGAALGADLEPLWDLAAMCELIHNGTLIIDDIEDDSPKRRGREATHLAFGHDVAVNAGNALYFLPVCAALGRASSLSEAGRLAVHHIVVEEMARLHCGQAMDIAWHRGAKAPAVDQYLQMCAFKTGTLARMSVRIAAAVAGASEDVTQAVGRYAESIGVAFQIQDDILNVTPSALSEGKGFGEDIHEGKMTLIAIHALTNTSDADRETLLTILRARTSDPDCIREAVGILTAAGSIDFARAKAQDLVRDAWLEAETTLPANPATDKLREFGEYLTTRDI